MGAIRRTSTFSAVGFRERKCQAPPPMEDPVSNSGSQSLTQLTRIEGEFECNHNSKINRAGKKPKGEISYANQYCQSGFLCPNYLCRSRFGIRLRMRAFAMCLQFHVSRYSIPWTAAVPICNASTLALAGNDLTSPTYGPGVSIFSRFLRSSAMIFRSRKADRRLD